MSTTLPTDDGTWQTTAEISDSERYARYMTSREWGVRKRPVKARSGGICERCKINPSTAVHHISYARKYHEEPEDLMDLCDACHKFLHAKSDEDPLQVQPKQIEIATTLIGVFKTQDLFFLFFNDNEPDIEVWNPSSFYVVKASDEYKAASMLCGRAVTEESLRNSCIPSHRGHLGRHYAVILKDGSPRDPRIVESFRLLKTSIFDPTEHHIDLIGPAQEFFSINAG